MIVLNEITLKNFEYHIDLTVKFKKGINSIIGVNGAGKSTIIRAIQFLFTGLVFAERKELAIKSGYSTGYVTGTFTFNDKEGYLERHLDSNKVLLKYDGKVYKKATEIKDVWDELFSINADVFNKVVVANQLEIPSIFSGDTAVREKVFQKIFVVPNTTPTRSLIWDYIKDAPSCVYDEDALTSVLNSIAEYSNEIEKLKADLVDIDESKLHELDERIDEFKKRLQNLTLHAQLQVSIDKCRVTLLPVQSEIKAYAHVVGLVEEEIQSDYFKVESYEKNKVTLDKLKMQVATNKGLLAEVKEEIQSLINELDDFVPLEVIDAELQKLEQQYSKAEQLKKYKVQLKDVFSEEERADFKRRHDEYVILHDKLIALEKKYAVEEENYKLFIQGEDVVCPHCKQNINDRDHIEKAYKAELKKIQKEIEILTDPWERLSNDSAMYMHDCDACKFNEIIEKQILDLGEVVYSEKEHEYKKELRQKIVKILNKQKKEEDAIEDYERAIVNDSAAIAAISKNETWTDEEILKVKKIYKDFKAYNELVKRETSLLTEIENLEAAQRNFNITYSKEDVENALEQTEKLKVACKAIVDKSKEDKFKLQYLERDLLKFENEKKELEIRKLECDKIKLYVDTLTEVYQAFHPTQFSRKLISTYTADVEEITDYYLKQFNFPYTIKFNDNFGVTVFDSNENEIPTISGGEQIMLGLCIRFALHSIFSNNFKLLILDEPTQSLHEDAIALFYAMLTEFKKSSTVDQIILVDHHSSIQDITDNLIVIEK